MLREAKKSVTKKKLQVFVVKDQDHRTITDGEKNPSAPGRPFENENFFPAILDVDAALHALASTSRLVASLLPATGSAPRRRDTYS